MPNLTHLVNPSVILGRHLPEILKNETLADIFRQTASSFGESPAVHFQETLLTYTELNRLTDQLASALMAKGLGRGARIGIWMERSIALHASIMAVVKAGAAWVPVDASVPSERARVTYEDAQVAAVITDKPLNEVESLIPITKVLPYETLSAEAEDFKTPPALLGPQPDDPAYLIYTSGSTGKPKGIEITHRNICHFIRSENHLLGVRQTDTVWQGFSPSFDMWLEEVAISWLVGAFIEIGSRLDMLQLDSLASKITANKVTVLHCVPTMLGMIDEDMPTVRLINLGGEACQEHLVKRWWHAGRQMFNTYGPTETTVSATMTELFPGDPITIGLPLPNYQVYIVDEAMQPVRAGEIGELIVGGPGVSAGYVGRPDLTAEKFLPKPLELSGSFPTIYRTGDAASLDESGRILFHGRLDDQIKLRGYRIELGEIEALLSARSDIRAAAVAVRQDAQGIDQLAAFIVPTEAHAMISDIRQELKKNLPSYMVPPVIQFIDDLPRLASGKIDRKRLPEIKDLLPEVDEARLPPRTETEAYVVAVCSKLFGGRAVGAEDDFFNDLGGHSLLVAALVSELRKDARYRMLSIGEVYADRTVDQIAKRLEQIAQSQKQTQTSNPKKNYHPISQARYVLCGIAQALVLPLIFALVSYEFFGPLLAHYWANQNGLGAYAALGISMLTFIAVTPILMLLSIVAKWLLLGRVQAGDYPLWGGFYWRWWLAQKLMAFVPTHLLAGTALYAGYLRLLGAKIGKQVYLDAVRLDAPDLIAIGNEVSFGCQAHLLAACVENGLLRLRPIKIDDHAYIGASSLVSGGARIEAWGELGDLSLLQENQTIPSAEVWNGVPARFIRTSNEKQKSTGEKPSLLRQSIFAVVQILLLTILPIAMFLPLLPILFAINAIQSVAPGQLLPLLLAAPILASVYVILFATQVVVLKKLILRRIEPGVYSTWSLFYLRKWLVDQVLKLSLNVLHPVYASLYLAPWLRMLGAKIGQRTEISTASEVTHDLLEIGDEAFIADRVVLGHSCIRHNRMELKQTSIGSRTFAGNCAVLPDGAQLGSDILLGCLSTSDLEHLNNMPAGTTWFGSPAMVVPRREAFSGFSETLTYNPSQKRVLARLIVEGLRIILPPMVILLGGIAAATSLHHIGRTAGWGIATLMLPVLFACFMVVPAYLITLILKWVAIGRYKPTVAPMWTPFVWLSEAVTTTYESLAIPFFLGYLQGTPFLPMALRLFGVKIGRRVYLDTADITEYDCVSIGDEAVLDSHCGPQTHLFEDRIMKIGNVQIGDRAVIGAHTIALYNSLIEEGAQLAHLSMVMKGETIPSDSTWVGSPAKPAS